MDAPPAPGGDAGALGVGVGPTTAGAGAPPTPFVAEIPELLRPIFVGVASFDDVGPPFSLSALALRALPIVSGIIPVAADVFLEFFSTLLPLLADVASSSFFFDEAVLA